MFAIDRKVHLEAAQRGNLMPENIDILTALRKQREEYVRFHHEALKFANRYPNSDLGDAMAYQRRILNSAILNIDTALDACDRV